MTTPTLRERVIAMADATYYDDTESLGDRDRSFALAVAAMVAEECALTCVDEEIYPEERWGGIYNVAVKTCAAAIRKRADELA